MLYVRWKRADKVYSTPYIEMSVKRSETYKAVANRAAKKCNLVCDGGKRLCLFKLNGARILNEDIIIDGELYAVDEIVLSWVLVRFCLGLCFCVVIVWLFPPPQSKNR